MRGLIKQFATQLLCRHYWQTQLIFSPGRNTHHDVQTCIRCGRSETVFSGTRSEWYSREREFELIEMSAEEFSRQYMGGFEPDPRVDECVEFLGTATEQELRHAKRYRYFDNQVMRQARMIIERNKTNEKD